MQSPKLVMWPTTREELISVQNQLGVACPESWNPTVPVRSIGGCFICYPKGHADKGIAGDPYWAAAACLFDGQLAALEAEFGETTAPYEPGLLALQASAGTGVLR